MGGALSEEQCFAWQIGETALTVTYRILRWTGAAWSEEDTGSLTERAGGLYEVKFTPATAGIWLGAAYYTSGVTRYDYGLLYFIAMGIEQDIYDVLKAGGAGDLAAILADTAELQGDLVNGGRLDLLIDQILADTAEMQADLANAGRLDTIFDAIKAKTDNLPSDPADQSAVEAHVTSEVDDLIIRAKGLDDTHDDLDSHITALGVIDGFHDVPAADAVTNAQMRDGIGNKEDVGVQDADATTKSVIAMLKGILDALLDTDGVYSWPGAAAPGDGVSIVEVIRYIAENLSSIGETSDGQLVADGSVQTVFEEATPTDYWEPKTVLISLGNMASGDTVQIVEWVKVREASSYEALDGKVYNDAQTTRKVIPVGPPPFALRWAYKVTLEQTAGSYKNFNYQVAKRT